jgi:hypothetical protein
MRSWVEIPYEMSLFLSLLILSMSRSISVDVIGSGPLSCILLFIVFIRIFKLIKKRYNKSC